MNHRTFQDLAKELSPALVVELTTILDRQRGQLTRWRKRREAAWKARRTPKWRFLSDGHMLMTFRRSTGKHGYMKNVRRRDKIAEARSHRRRDKCEVCKGANGGVRGNENIIDGKIVCDYCSAPLIHTDQ